MIYRITHVTQYAYGDQVNACHNLAHMVPRATGYQRTLEGSVEVTPLPAHHVVRDDYFGNRVSHFSIQQPHRNLEIRAQSVVEVDAQQREAWLDWSVDCGEARRLLQTARDRETLAAREYRLDSPLVRSGDALADYAQPSFDGDAPLLTAVDDLNRRIHADFTYDPGFTTTSTPLADVVEHRRGVCQDFAHLAIGCLRALGFAARYVSGYMETSPPPGQPKLRGADASHAWFAVYVPGTGWVEFDPTNAQRVGSRYVTTAWGRDYADVTPLKGVIFGGGSGHDLNVAVDMDRIG